MRLFILVSVLCASALLLSDVFSGDASLSAPVPDFMAPSMVMMFSSVRSVQPGRKPLVFSAGILILSVAVAVARLIPVWHHLHAHAVCFLKLLPPLLASVMLAFLFIPGTGRGGISAASGMQPRNLSVFFCLLTVSVYRELSEGLASAVILGVLSCWFYAVQLINSCRWRYTVPDIAKRQPAGRNEPDSMTPGGLFRRIKELFEKEKPYLDADLKVGDVARMLYTNKAYISRAINDNTGKNFCQYVNQYRINYSVEAFKENPHLRVNELAQMSGFRTLVSYNMAFRMLMDEAPGEWCRNYRKECGLSVQSRDSDEDFM